MDLTLGKLYDLLDGCCDVLLELRQQLLDERVSIISLDTTAMERRRESIESLMGAMHDLNNQAEQEILSLCKVARVADGSIETLLEGVPSHKSQQLRDQKRRLLTLATEVNEILEANRALLSDSLAFAEHSLSLFTRMLKTGSNMTYGQHGMYQDRVNSEARIIRKEA